MAVRAHFFTNPLRHSPSADSVPQPNRESLVSDLAPEGHRSSMRRGFAIAVALSVPFWLALYLLLR
jgi:hypothetical protein